MVKVSKARAAVLREQIFDSTAVELCRVGYDATALTAVAAGCGLATSAIYNRFPDKHSLVSALITERLEPDLGNALDADLSSIWHETSLIGLVDGDLLCVLQELQLAARRVPEIRADLAAFVARRVDTALEARGQAEARGQVRQNQDPRAQVLLQAAAETGSYLLSLASEAPTGGMASVDRAVRIALTSVAWSMPIPPGRASRRRTDPGTRDPGTAGLDELGQALLASASEVFAEQGYDAATMAEIARHASVTTGAIYNRFSGKAGLLSEVVDGVTRRQVADSLCAIGTALTSSRPSAAGRTIGSLMGVSPNSLGAGGTTLRLEACHASRLEPEVAEVLGPIHEHGIAALTADIRAAQTAEVLRSDVDADALAWWFASLPLGVAVVGAGVPGSIDWAPTLAAMVRALRTHPC